MHRNHIKIRLNSELLLDAGICEEIQGRGSPEVIIRPPRTTLFHQLLKYLRTKSDPADSLPGSLVGRHGVAAAAVTLRWGSWLAVLLDMSKPMWPEITTQSTSRIDDGEMARINIEASAALAEWIDLYRANPSDYIQLVNRAVFYLPMPKKTSTVEHGAFGVLSMPKIAAEARESVGAEQLERVRAECERFPSRIFANALINTAWRNGPVEDLHAGYFRGSPLDRRRLTLAEEGEVMAVASRRLAGGMETCRTLQMRQPPRIWSDQVLPYGLAHGVLITPSMWTLSESSREVRLLLHP